MEVWLLESIYDNTLYSQIVLRIDDIIIGCDGWEDYETLSVFNYTQVFWDSVTSQQEDLLTYVGEL